MKLSGLFSLNLRDAIHGFLIAFLTSVLSAVVALLNTGAMPGIVDLKNYAMIGLTAGISYVTKNLFSNSDGELLKKDA